MINQNNIAKLQPSMFRRPSIAKEALQAMETFPENPLTTSLVNYPMGRYIKSSVDAVVKRGSKDRQGDLCVRAAQTCMVPTKGKLLASNFNSCASVLALLAMQAPLAKHIAEAVVLYSDSRLEEMFAPLCDLLKAMAYIPLQAEFVVTDSMCQAIDKSAQIVNVMPEDHGQRLSFSNALATMRYQLEQAISERESINQETLRVSSLVIVFLKDAFMARACKLQLNCAMCAEFIQKLEVLPKRTVLWDASTTASLAALTLYEHGLQSYQDALGPFQQYRKNLSSSDALPVLLPEKPYLAIVIEFCKSLSVLRASESFSYPKRFAGPNEGSVDRCLFFALSGEFGKFVYRTHCTGKVFLHDFVYFCLFNYHILDSSA
jgi:hypothetical protein